MKEIRLHSNWNQNEIPYEVLKSSLCAVSTTDSTPFYWWDLKAKVFFSGNTQIRNQYFTSIVSLSSVILTFSGFYPHPYWFLHGVDILFIFFGRPVEYADTSASWLWVYLIFILVRSSISQEIDAILLLHTADSILNRLILVSSVTTSIKYHVVQLNIETFSHVYASSAHYLITKYVRILKMNESYWSRVSAVLRKWPN